MGMGVRDTLIAGQSYKVFIDGIHTCDNTEFAGYINDSNWAEIVPMSRVFAWSISDNMYKTEQIAGGWRTWFAIECKRNVTVGDFIAYCAASANATDAVVFGGGVEGASTTGAAIAAAPARFVAGVVTAAE